MKQYGKLYFKFVRQHLSPIQCDPDGPLATRLAFCFPWCELTAFPVMIKFLH